MKHTYDLERCEDCLRYIEECICRDKCSKCGHPREEHAMLWQPAEDISEQTSWHACTTYANNPSIKCPIKRIVRCCCKEFEEPLHDFDGLQDAPGQALRDADVLHAKHLPEAAKEGRCYCLECYHERRKLMGG